MTASTGGTAGAIHSHGIRFPVRTVAFPANVRCVASLSGGIMSSTEFRRSATLAERLLRLRNYQSKDFWAMVFARPLTILFLLPVADVAWVTPNLITWVSVVVKLAGIAALGVWPGWTGGVVGGLLVNLGLVLDNMDGTLARYRGTSTYLGYYLDKAVDNLTLAAMFGAFGYRAWVQSGDPWELAICMAGLAGAQVAAYAKWVSQKVGLDADLNWHAQNQSLQAYALARTNQNPSEPPPKRSFGQWIRFVGEAFFSIVKFNEVDIFFFLLLALVVDQLWIFSKVACAVYALGLLIGPIKFYFDLRAKLAKQGYR